MSTDRDLVRSMLHGDEVAAGAFVDRFSRFVWSILTRDQGLGQEDAEDLYQEVFIHLFEDDFRRLRSWRGGELVPFLGQVVRNLVRDRRRRGARRPGQESLESTTEMATSEPGPEAESMTAEAGSIVRAALAGLRPADRVVLERRYIGGESYQEIAAALGLTVNHVGVRLNRARRRLLDALDHDHSELRPTERGVSRTPPTAS